MHTVQFRSSAALLVADFFDDLAGKDEVQEEVWKQLSTQYEKEAFDEVSSVESNHLLFLLLNIPLEQHNGRSLCRLAIEQNRTEFLKNERINSLTTHLYEHKFLQPEGKVQMSSMDNYKMFEMLVTKPFKFFFLPRGYH